VPLAAGTAFASPRIFIKALWHHPALLISGVLIAPPRTIDFYRFARNLFLKEFSFNLPIISFANVRIKRRARWLPHGKPYFFPSA